MYITNDLEIHTLDKLKVEMSTYIHRSFTLYIAL